MLWLLSAFETSVVAFRSYCLERHQRIATGKEMARGFVIKLEEVTESLKEAQRTANKYR